VNLPKRMIHKFKNSKRKQELLKSKFLKNNQNNLIKKSTKKIYNLMKKNYQVLKKMNNKALLKKLQKMELRNWNKAINKRQFKINNLIKNLNKLPSPKYLNKSFQRKKVATNIQLNMLNQLIFIKLLIQYLL